MEKMKIGIINSTVRDNRVSIKICKWIVEQANKHGESEFEIIDLKDYPMGFNIRGEDEHAARFNEKLNELDGFIFVIAEYNHSIPGVLKNALDWASMKAVGNKPAGIVSYGAIGGARSAEHMRGILSGLNIPHVYRQVMLNIFTDFDQERNFSPADFQEEAFEDLIKQLELWAKAFKSIR